MRGIYKNGAAPQPFLVGQQSVPTLMLSGASGLAINQPGDKYEQEADRVADQVKWIKSRDFIKWYYNQGVYGSASTGVLSRADLQANRQGFLFYTDLWADPAKKMDMCNYVGELWNERKELNTYVPGVSPTGPKSTSMEAENP